MPKAFPKTIYVTREGEGDDEYLNVRASVEEGFDDSTRVAVYQLVEVGMVTVTRKYESPKSRAR